MDQAIQNFVRPFISPAKTQVISELTKLASPKVTVVWVFLIFIFFLYQRKIRNGIGVIVIFSGGGILLSIIKQVIARQRPFERMVPEGTYSFPSGHTFGSLLLLFTFFYLIVPYFNKLKPLIQITMTIFFLFIIFSRVYLFVHFPTDILGGIFYASFWWYLCSYFAAKYRFWQ
ncbi:phosphatidylglycerophosphatase B [Xylocopilactobacillus apis]|uniref:Phosphatidylglycerophosphatase B n=1 Tax=Xylocopilactobacillus apis TaxID=2932183 RepID=A0AAU9DBS1_9LACO|nr:phosphatidylglycerophosphatase B [Xylocopilactobacillus apis]